ncbi:MAG: hypothetical protein AWM53_01185 [Candidatus Dichloromethanomonas elyunquensis]|nr:MAG: hypothetical protein AWM53_01185 [Candidatus Dichloromethanomonas elyunquensis]
MLISIIRTVILYLIIVAVLRVMGKRQIGQLQPFELVIVLMISELAAIPSQDIGIPLIAGLLPVLILLLLGITISHVSLKSEKARAIICGTPTVLIDKGHILEDELRKLRYNLSDLLEQLRVKNIPDLADVEYAILETNGQLSVIPKSTKRPANPEDLKIEVAGETLPYTLIMDGVLQQKNFTKANVNMNWLEQELTKANIKDYKKVLIASIGTQGKLYVQEKADKSSRGE